MNSDFLSAPFYLHNSGHTATSQHYDSAPHLLSGPPVHQTTTYSPEEFSGMVSPPLSSTSQSFYNLPHTLHSDAHYYVASGAPEYHSNIPQPQQYYYPPPPPPAMMHNMVPQQYSTSAPMGYVNSASPPSSPSMIVVSEEMKQKRREIVSNIQESHFVKLTKMTPERIFEIQELAREKGLDPSIVETVLRLFTPEGKNSFHQHINPSSKDFVRDDDIYINITVNGGYDTSSDSEDSKPTKKKTGRKAKPDYVKRPLNSFMLYRKSQTKNAMAYAAYNNLKLNHQNISQIISFMWRTEDKEVKEQFTVFANKEKEIHKALYPDYKFCPQKKRRRELTNGIVF